MSVRCLAERLVCTKCSERVSHSVVSNSLRPHRLGPTRLLCPWNSPGKNTVVGIPFSNRNGNSCIIDISFPFSSLCDHKNKLMGCFLLITANFTKLENTIIETSHMALVVKNPPANAEDAEDTVGTIPWGGNGNPLQYSCLKKSVVTQRTGRDCAHM